MDSKKKTPKERDFLLEIEDLYMHVWASERKLVSKRIFLNYEYVFHYV